MDKGGAERQRRYLGGLREKARRWDAVVAGASNGPLTGHWLACVVADANGAEFLALWADNGAVADVGLVAHLGAGGTNLAAQVSFLNEEYAAVEEAQGRVVPVVKPKVLGGSSG